MSSRMPKDRLYALQSVLRQSLLALGTAAEEARLEPLFIEHVNRQQSLLRSRPLAGDDASRPAPHHRHHGVLRHRDPSDRLHELHRLVRSRRLRLRQHGQALNRRGVSARVVKDGVVRVGDRVEKVRGGRD